MKVPPLESYSGVGMLRFRVWFLGAWGLGISVWGLGFGV